MHKVANQAESRYYGLTSRGKLERHAALHYLGEMLDCAAAQTEPRTDVEFCLCTEWRLNIRWSQLDAFWVHGLCRPTVLPSRQQICQFPWSKRPFATTSINAFTSVSTVKGEPRLVTKQDVSPSVHRKLTKAVSSQPVHPVLTSSNGYAQFLDEYCCCVGLACLLLFPPPSWTGHADVPNVSHDFNVWLSHGGVPYEVCPQTAPSQVYVAEVGWQLTGQPQAA